MAHKTPGTTDGRPNTCLTVAKNVLVLLALFVLGTAFALWLL